MAGMTTTSPSGLVPNDVANAAAAASLATIMILGSSLSLRGSGIFLPMGNALPMGVNASELVKGLGLDGDVVIYAGRADLDTFGSGPSEGGAFNTWTGIQDEEVSVPSALKILGRELTDQLRARGLSGTEYLTDPVSLAIATARGYDKTLTADLCVLAATVTPSVGATGTAMTHDTFMDAVDATPSTDPGQRIMVLHPAQFKAWKRDLEQRGGLTQWRDAAVDVQLFRGEGFQGVYDGVEVWTCEEVTEDGDDYIGFICSAGSVMLREDAQAPPFPGQIIIADIGTENGPAILRIAASRQEESQKGRIILTATCGMAVMPGNRLVKIIATGL